MTVRVLQVVSAFFVAAVDHGFTYISAKNVFVSDNNSAMKFQVSRKSNR